jgi:MerR family transcriptional regulator, thiopeptide resistance regulator
VHTTKSAKTYSVGAVARLAGVTIRTLHHYDAIGLLRPSGRASNGYRRYDQNDLERLQRILAYRELELPLEVIASLLDGDDDPLDHLRLQHELLTERRTRLERLLATLERTMEAHTMGIRLTPEELLEVFGETDVLAHSAEAEERWGDTDAWRQSQARTSRYTKHDWQEIMAESERITARIAEVYRSGAAPESEAAMDAVEAHRVQISERFYECSHEMQVHLGDMYVADPRFTATYEAIAEGLAVWVRDAIHANARRSSS